MEEDRNENRESLRMASWKRWNGKGLKKSWDVALKRKWGA